ncbi:MAG: methionyl-tRNA formyltransferase [Verrucomicrobia bacterium]|nr:MAG: methionyl-tRNA formyltransferase [Verrucomicrobiota bacterium]
MPFLRLKRVFAVEGSPLHRELKGEEHSVIEAGRHKKFLDELDELDFDLLVSNGCPVIFPVSRLQKPHQLFLNVHPSLLPDFRGFHPANGALLKGAKETGATLHEMVDRVDRGAVVHQERFPITPDLDLGLLYHLLFTAEARAFVRGMQKIFQAEFKCIGEPQGEVFSHYRRSQEDMSVDFEGMGNAEILRRVRAFGITSQGVRCQLEGRLFTLFEARALCNPLLLDLYSDGAPGTVVLEYGAAMVVRSREGLIQVSKFLKG